MSFMAAALPFLSAGFSILQGVAGMRANQQNARFAESEADSAIAASKEDAQRQRQINIAKLGEFRAQAGAQGSTFEGSPMLVYLNNVKNAALDEQDLLYKGKLQAFGKRQEAKIYDQQAGSSLFGGIAGAAGSLGSTLLTSK